MTQHCVSPRQMAFFNSKSQDWVVFLEVKVSLSTRRTHDEEVFSVLALTF